MANWHRTIARLRSAGKVKPITMDGKQLRRNRFDDEDCFLFDRNGRALRIVSAVVEPVEYFRNPFRNLLEIGSGCYATVYAIDDHTVLKVTDECGVDNGYGRLVELALANPDNPHFPRIHYAGHMHDKFVYVIERLNDDYGASHECVQLFDLYKSNPTRVNLDPSMKQAFDLLIENRLTADICEGNILTRADGTPVITDPMFSFS